MSLGVAILVFSGFFYGYIQSLRKLSIYKVMGLLINVFVWLSSLFVLLQLFENL